MAFVAKAMSSPVIYIMIVSGSMSACIVCKGQYIHIRGIIPGLVIYIYS